MKDIKASIKRKTITKEVTFIEFDGFTTDFLELYDLIDKVEGSNTFFPSITMNDTELRRKLEELKVISVNMRGGVGEGKSYKRFKKIVDVLMDEYLDKSEKDELENK